MASDLTEEQAYWLRRVLESRPKHGVLDTFTIPHEVYHVLIGKGLIRWHHRAVEITLDGIRAIARHQPQ